MFCSCKHQTIKDGFYRERTIAWVRPTHQNHRWISRYICIFWFLNAEFENSVQDKAISAEQQKIESQWMLALPYIYVYVCICSLSKRIECPTSRNWENGKGNEGEWQTREKIYWPSERT